jgi:hypothetical protein
MIQKKDESGGSRRRKARSRFEGRRTIAQSRKTHIPASRIRPPIVLSPSSPMTTGVAEENQDSRTELHVLRMETAINTCFHLRPGSLRALQMKTNCGTIPAICGKPTMRLQSPRGMGNQPISVSEERSTNAGARS